jgi:uncharacterized protein
VTQIYVQSAGRRVGFTNSTLLVRFCFVYIALLFFSAASSADCKEVPDYTGYINDYASMMSTDVRAKLEEDLRSFDLSDSTQVAILTIDSLDGDALEDFSIRVVEQWKIGQKNKDNGVLFLAVKNDRKMRIEVGRGLEHLLTDLAAGRIIDRVVAPQFKAARFNEGFASGVAAIIQTTRGEYKPEAWRGRGQGSGEPPLLFKYLFFGLAFVAFLGGNSRMLGVVGGAVLLPLMFFIGLPGTISWPFLLMLIPLGALAGLLLSLLINAIMKHSGRGGGYYTGGGFGGSGGGFGGGGFGGFGGGGFGGGGASGGW